MILVAIKVWNIVWKIWFHTFKLFSTEGYVLIDLLCVLRIRRLWPTIFILEISLATNLALFESNTYLKNIKMLFYFKKYSWQMVH